MDAGNLKKLDDLDQLHTSIKPFQLSNPEAFFDYRSGILRNGFFELQRWDECVDTYKKPIKWPKNKSEDVGEAFEYQMFLLQCVQAFLAGGDYSKAKAKDFEDLLIHWVNGGDKALKLFKLQQKSKPMVHSWLIHWQSGAMVCHFILIA